MKFLSASSFSRQFATCGLTLLLVQNALGAEPARGPSFPRIANVYGTAFTEDGTSFHGDNRRWEEAARYDLLVGVQRWQRDDPDGKVFREQMKGLKKINPHLIALQFACSAPYTHVIPDNEAIASRQPGQILPWLLQADGKPIAGWPGTYMLNLAAPGVVEWLAQQTVPAVQQIGYDGVFIDCLGPHFDSWACEIATGKPYTVDYNADGQDDDREELTTIWTQAKTALARRTRELLGSEAVFMANQAGPDTYEHLNGIYLEDYIDAVLDRGMSWDKVLEEYLHWTKTRRQPNVTVLGCSSGVEPPFDTHNLSQEERSSYFDRGQARLGRMRFGLTTTLLGDGYYSFDLHTRWRGQYWWYPEFDAPLGYPTEPCQRQTDGTWRRHFDGGLVVVNPTDWDAPVELDQLHRDISSGQIDRRFVLPRLDGRIYLPSGGPIEPGTFPAVEPPLTATGPAGVVERDGHLVLRDGQGMAILIGPGGAIESLCLGGKELIDTVTTVIVTDDKWQNFDTQNLKHQIGPDGSITLTGQRTDGQQTLEFTQTLRLANSRLSLDYHWRAQTPLHVKAFRQSVCVPPRLFGGRAMSTDTDPVHLPQDMAGDPYLARNITSARLPIGDGQSLAVRLPQAAHLIDDRHYGGPGYLLAFYPVADEIAAGREWSYAIEIEGEKGSGLFFGPAQ